MRVVLIKTYGIISFIKETQPTVQGILQHDRVGKELMY